MKHTVFPLQLADSLQLEFNANGHSTYSHNYKDIYFQAGLGAKEKQHVFLKGNNLPQNWLSKDYFTIAETGFGTGLNFTNTLKLWSETSKSHQQLHYLSCELHPLSSQQLKQSLSSFPELSDYSQQLIKLYPEELFYGFHRLHFKSLRVTLTLMIADATASLKQLHAQVDAWYLDGFAPSKNPELWNTQLFQQIARLSHKNTTLSTYTVARKIRESLTAVGFNIQKSKGFGQKREMLTATLQQASTCVDKTPWAYQYSAKRCQNYTIVGAGIAGLSLADKLISAGKKVTLIDRQSQPCLETSGNPQAMIMPSFSLNDSIEARFYFAAFVYALRYYNSGHYHQVGVYNPAYSIKQQQWQSKLLEKFNFPSSLLKEYCQGLLYPSSGWLDTQAHAQSLFLKLKGRKLNYIQAHIDEIKQQDSHWQVLNNNKIIHTTDCLILANGIHSRALLGDSEFPMTAKYGEISYFNREQNPYFHQQKHILLNKGYITPFWKGIQTMGATFEHMPKNKWYEPAQSSQQHWQKNCQLWENTPEREQLYSMKAETSRAGIRVTTADHLPLCGAVIKQNEFTADYHDIKHGKHWKHYPKPQNRTHLYLFTGLGSRGFTSAPLLAESLCNQILGLAQVLPTELQKAIHPNRFLWRKLKKM